MKVSPQIKTVAMMMESLPFIYQTQAVEHLRNYIMEMQDESKWDSLFEKSEDKLVQAARQAKREIAQGKAEPMDYERL